MVSIKLLLLRETHNALQLLMFFFFLFFYQPCPGLRYCKSVFLIFRISQYSGPKLWVQFFRDNHIIRIDISISIRIWPPNWQVATSWGVNSNGTDQAGPGDVITSRDKLKDFISTNMVAMTTKLGRMVTCLISPCP